jgi:hypothetical protein
MGTQPLITTNGNGSTKFSCAKKPYFNKDDAQKFAARLQREHPEQAQQYPYACDSCGCWHLTSLDPVSRELAKSSPTGGSSLHGLIPPAPGRRGRPPFVNDAQAAEAKVLLGSGMKLTAVAEKMGLTYIHLYNALIRTGNLVQKRHSKPRVPASPVRATPAIPARVAEQPKTTLRTIDDLEKDIAQLQAQIEQRKRLIEAKQLRLRSHNGYWIVEKEGNVISLSRDEATRLTEMLMEAVTV